MGRLAPVPNPGDVAPPCEAEAKQHSESNIRRAANNDENKDDVDIIDVQNEQEAATIEIIKMPNARDDMKENEALDEKEEKSLIFFKDVEAKIPQIGADSDFFDFESDWKWDAADYSDLDLCEPRWRGRCGHTHIQCSVCEWWWCIDDLEKVLKYKFNKHEKLIEGDLKKYILESNDEGRVWVGPCCTDNIIYGNIELWIDVLSDFINEQYGNRSGRLKYKDLLKSSDYAWRIIDIYRIKEVYKRLDYKKEKLGKYLEDMDWMSEGKDDFLAWVQKIRDKTKATAFEGFVPATDVMLFFELIQLKTFIIRFFMDHTESLLDNYDAFEAGLWRQIKLFVNKCLYSLQKLYEYEQNAAYNEAILEGLCSGAKHVYKPGMTNKTFLQALTNYLYLNENLQQRELVVNGIVDLHILRYDYGGDIESKYYEAKGTGANTIDKYKTLPTDGAWSLKSSQVSLQTLLNM